MQFPDGEVLPVWSLHVSPMSAWISSGCSGLPPQSITCILGLMFSWRPKGTDEDLVLGCRTMAARCPSEEDGSTAENKYIPRFIWQIK